MRPAGVAGSCTGTWDRTVAEIQVVLTDGIQEPFRQWLAGRGLYLFRIPGLDDDLPTYGVGVDTATSQERRD
jgi:hypothetical protein